MIQSTDMEHDPLLAELYRTPRDGKDMALAARCAPLIYFDAREPFLPIAAGVTFFTQDGPSASFERQIELRPQGKPPAAQAIEYAIWWDWDIHHLYELEHAWVYLDPHDQPVRVEASWHGKLYELPLQFEGGRVVLLSEPGKHAFAPHPDWFRERWSQFRRSETGAVGVHAHVLINAMFSGKIRRRAGDRLLARTFLAGQAFEPAWRFTQRYTFAPEALVPWPVLAGWIPRRVNAILERLEASTQPGDFRPLHLAGAGGDLSSLQAAADSGADSLLLSLVFSENGLMLESEHGPGLALEDAFAFLHSQPVGAFLAVNDPRVVDRVAWFVRSKDDSGSVVVLSTNPDLLAQYCAFVPGGATALQLESAGDDPLQAAAGSSPTYVYPAWAANGSGLTHEWIEHVHMAGLGVMAGPITADAQRETLRRSGADVLWLALPDR